MLATPPDRIADTIREKTHGHRVRVALAAVPKERRAGRVPGVHPGGVLRDEFLGPLGINPHGLAKSICLAESVVEAILEGKQAVTADIAIRLGRFFNVTPQFWLNLQAAYDVHEQLGKQSGAYAEIRVYHAGSPFPAPSTDEDSAGDFTAGQVTPAAADVDAPSDVNPRDGADMIHVPAAEFLMGGTESQVDALLHANSGLPCEWFESCLPQRWVYLDSCWIYRTPVTVGQYRKFCVATGRAMPSAPEFNVNWHRETHPIVNVTWDEASAYAKWAGGRLPTEAEWEKAARGADGRQYPWGNEWDPLKCANAVGKKPSGTRPVGLYLSGASPYGILDMAGNVWEWCLDWYDETYYKWAPARNPQGPPPRTYRVLRGGSWFNISPYMFRSAARDWVIPETRLISNGFRVAVCA
jgi:iron(II)-dependent oxidoreductase